MYQRLIQFKNEHGHCLVPRKFEKDPKLSTWVETQRILWNRDYRGKPSRAVTDHGIATEGDNHDAPPHLSPDDRNDSLFADERDVPMLSEPAHAPEEEQEYCTNSHVGRYSQQLNEDHVVPFPRQPEDTEPDFPTAQAGVLCDVPELGDLVVPTTDLENNNGKRLTLERKHKLDQIGFVWSLRTKRIEDHWDTMFRQLLDYKTAHGDCLVPSRYEANAKLAKWVETQRYEYTKLRRASKAGSIKSQSLTEWDATCGATDLSEGEGPFLGKSGDAAVDGFDNLFFADATTGQPGSSEMPSSQNSVMMLGTLNPRLTEDRLRRLESIGFEWKVKHKMKRYYDKKWDTEFEKLKAFREANGHCMVRAGLTISAHH
jgi:Helicase associated domain